MKTIYKISKAELRNLFYSPVAWFLVIIFMVLCAVYYTDMIYKIAKMQELAQKSPLYKGLGAALTNKVYLDADGIFVNAMKNLYLFIPLLTMAILSREKSTGSIKLLYSSPIKTRDIVLGKYLSLMLFNLVLIAVIGIFMAFGLLNIKSVDVGLLLSASLGFYLLVCAYASIGLFMSSLTTYQIVSAIGTFIIVFILTKIGNLWQEYDFVRDLTYFLSMNGRANKMLSGLITTKDVLYFLVVIGIFLGFTLIKLKAGRESRPWYIITGRYIAVLVVALLVGYVSSRPKMIGYWDTTSAQTNTVHPRVQQILKNLNDDDLEITLYSNLFQRSVRHGLPQSRNIYLTNLWEPFVRFAPNIKFKYEYYYDLKEGDPMYSRYPGKNIQEMAKDHARSLDLDVAMFKTPQEMKKQIDLAPEDYNLVMQLKYKGRTTFLRTYNDSKVWPSQDHIAAALARLQEEKMPTILFSSGNLERNIHVTGERGYYSSTIGKGERTSLINNGFDMDTIRLDSQDIPVDDKNIAALVVADPKTSLSPVVQEKIQAYINAGGNVMILGESGKSEVINPIIAPLGLQLSTGVLVQPSANQAPDQIAPTLAKYAADLAEEDALIALKKGDIAKLQSYSESLAPIEIVDRNKGFKLHDLTVTDTGAVWLKKGLLVKDSVPPVFSPNEGDIKKDLFTTSMVLTRQLNGKEQRLLVAGDADFLSNRFNGGQFFGRAIYSWLGNNEYPIYRPTAAPEDSELLITPEVAAWQRRFFIYILPIILTLLGAIILVRRKRK